MISPPDNPARLILPADWRVFGFGVVLIAGVMLLFGLAAGAACFGGEAGERAEGRRGSAYAAALDVRHDCGAGGVLFSGVVCCGLFVATFHSLSNRPIGFDASRLLLLETVVPHGQPPAAWAQMGETLRGVPGVEKVAASGWPLLSTGGWNGSISLMAARGALIGAIF